MKKYLSIVCLILTLSMLLCACKNNTPDIAYSSDTQTQAVSGVVELILDGEAKYGIVRASNMSNAAVDSCAELFSAIYKATSVRVPFITDDYTLDAGIKEILVGNTSREESKRAMDDLETSEYVIKIVDDALVIAAENDTALVDAVNAFIEQCLSNASQGKWTMDANLSIEGRGSEDGENGPYINVSGTLKATATKKNDPNIDAFYSLEGGRDYFTWVQGGCVINNYLYTFMITDKRVLGDEKCVIIKSDIETGEVISYSKEMALGHANDATYNPDENTIVVANCTDGSILHVLDADTLQLKKNVNISGGIFSITYDPIKKHYIGVGHEYIYYYTSTFKYSHKIAYTYTQGMSGIQGVLSDGKYLYMLEYYQNPNDGFDIKNNLVVYELYTAKRVTTIDLGINREAENIGYYNGKFYVSCNNISWKGLDFFVVEIS